MSMEATLWGVDGELHGNEDRVYSGLPFFRIANSVSAARRLYWSDRPGDVFEFQDEHDATQHGTPFDLSSPPLVSSGQVVAVAGPVFVDYLQEFDAVACESFLGSFKFRSARFHLGLLDEEAYEEVLGELAASLFRRFDELAREAMSPGAGLPDQTLQDRLGLGMRLLKGVGLASAEEKAVRRLVLASISRDPAAFRRTLRLAAIRLRRPEQEVEALVSEYLAVLMSWHSTIGIGAGVPIRRSDSGVLVVTPAREVLRPFDVDPGQLNHLRDEPEFEQTLTQFIGYVGRFGVEQVRSIAQREDYLYSTLQYPELEQDERLLKCQKSITSSILGYAIGTGHQLQTGGFAEVDSLHSHTARVMYLYPFFQTSRRRASFGVLPWGHQESFGVLIDSGHPALSWLFNNAINKGSRPDIGHAQFTDVGLEDASSFLTKAVSQSLKQGGGAYSTRGYVVDEMALAIFGPHVADIGHQNTRDYLTLVERGSPEMARFVKAPLPRPATPIQFSKWDFFLFDWADYHWYLSQAHKNLRAIRVRHRLEVPVGIGFSLAMFPTLVKASLWSQLVSLGRQVYSSEKGFLVERGIDVHLPKAAGDESQTDESAVERSSG